MPSTSVACRPSGSVAAAAADGLDLHRRPSARSAARRRRCLHVRDERHLRAAGHADAAVGASAISTLSGSEALSGAYSVSRRLQPARALAEQRLHQLPDVRMEVRVDAIAELALLDDEVLRLLRLGDDDLAGPVDEVGVLVAVDSSSRASCNSWRPPRQRSNRPAAACGRAECPRFRFDAVEVLRQRRVEAAAADDVQRRRRCASARSCSSDGRRRRPPCAGADAAARGHGHRNRAAHRRPTADVRRRQDR